ncbi:hypothetical protein EOJ36_10140 [Sandaracinomonas limnophila]|uniref:Antitoxin n=1 Tax=Sandaracinomonas limnophila TaxID=1862386 RepID=A0A437PMB6_9BACT|nr:DUF6364 family protein [Sandaracinomonas limnophila]RVU23432.1 hypothetical protein EOJ36_10140 [Sandaracinomonas limnophila]
MTTKLTLSVEQSIIEKAKIYAKQTGRSLSEIIQNYLEQLVDESEVNEIPTDLNKLIGVIKLPKNFDEKNELQDYFESKHL